MVFSKFWRNNVISWIEENINCVPLSRWYCRHCVDILTLKATVAIITLNPLYVQLPNFISQSWSSNGNQVMSIKHVDLKMPGGMYVHDPVEVTTTLVGYVPSNASLALKENWTLSLGRAMITVFGWSSPRWIRGCAQWFECEGFLLAFSF